MSPGDLVNVRNAEGSIVEMRFVEQTSRLFYVVAPSAVEKYRLGLTEPVGVPKEDVFRIIR